MPFLRQSTSQTIRFGPCLDKADGVTEETGLTLAQADMRLSKDGGAFAQKNSAGNATHDSDGWYSTTLDTTDTNTVGELILNVHQPANMLPVWIRWYVVEETIYDNLFASAAAGAQTGDVYSLLTSAQAEPTSDPPESNETPMNKLGIVYAALTNKLVVNAGDVTFYNSSNVAWWKKDITTGPYTEAKAADANP